MGEWLEGHSYNFYLISYEAITVIHQIMSIKIKELSLSLVSCFGNSHILIFNPHSTSFGVRRFGTKAH